MTDETARRPMLYKTNGPETDDKPQPHSSGRTKPPKPVQHRWFDQWLIARGEPLKQLVQKVTEFVETRQQRKRARRPDDQSNHRRAVEGVVCNLAYAILNPPPTGWLDARTYCGSRGWRQARRLRLARFPRRTWIRLSSWSTFSRARRFPSALVGPSESYANALPFWTAAIRECVVFQVRTVR